MMREKFILIRISLWNKNYKIIWLVNFDAIEVSILYAYFFRNHIIVEGHAGELIPQQMPQHFLEQWKSCQKFRFLTDKNDSTNCHILCSFYNVNKCKQIHSMKKRTYHHISMSCPCAKQQLVYRTGFLLKTEENGLISQIQTRH